MINVLLLDRFEMTAGIHCESKKNTKLLPITAPNINRSCVQWVIGYFIIIIIIHFISGSNIYYMADVNNFLRYDFVTNFLLSLTVK